jgi:hypothetical protein
VGGMSRLAGRGWGSCTVPGADSLLYDLREHRERWASISHSKLNLSSLEGRVIDANPLLVQYLWFLHLA